MIEHLSFSSVSKSYQCASNWKTTYIDKIKTPSGEAASWGTHYGVVLQARLLGIPLTSEQEKDIPLEIYEAVEDYLKQEKSWKSADEIEKEISICPDKWKWLAEKYGANSEIHWPLIGYIDVLKDGVPMDLKTTKRAGFQSYWGLQCTLYALSQNSKRWEVHTCVRNKYLNFNFYSHYLSDNEIRSTMNWVANGSKRIKDIIEATNAPEEIPGFWCSYCPKITDCGIYIFANMEKES